VSERAYGIGRVPGDVDPIEELMAEVEAERLQPTPPLAGGQVCPAGTTNGQVLKKPARCMVCGRPADGWNSGAGGPMCARHWDDY
jgi:hypothetical protein